MLRTKTCGELRLINQGERVTICGWVDSTSDHGGVCIVDVRDRYGKLQTVFYSTMGTDLFELVKTLRNEDVVRIHGEVVPRPEGLVNSGMLTGEIEIKVENLEILNRSDVLPFQQKPLEPLSEDIHLKYRYLDLRRPEMQSVLALRHKMTKAIREFLDDQNFLEIETPFPDKNFPEGVCDHRVSGWDFQDSFYAFPQLQSIYKRLLMIAGCDRYYQFVRCFRGGDFQTNRQSEITQLEVEMSFIEMDDIMELTERLLNCLMKTILGRDLSLPVTRITYNEAMERFGHDVPDLRFGMELQDITDIARGVDFNVFRVVAENGGRIRGINVKKAADKFSRKDIDVLTNWVKEQYGAKGLAWFKVDADGILTGSSAKNFSSAALLAIGKRLDAEPNDFLLFSADSFFVTNLVLNGLRNHMAARLKLTDPDDMNFCWIIKRPMFDCSNEGTPRYITDQPFIAPLSEDIALMETDPVRVRAADCHLVLNGMKVAAGAVHIHDFTIQNKVFSLLGMTPQEVDVLYGFLLNALRLGAPPHGGITFELDLLVMLFAKMNNIRDCIAFPKVPWAMDLISSATISGMKKI